MKALSKPYFRDGVAHAFFGPKNWTQSVHKILDTLPIYLQTALVHIQRSHLDFGHLPRISFETQAKLLTCQQLSIESQVYSCECTQLNKQPSVSTRLTVYFCNHSLTIHLTCALTS